MKVSWAVGPAAGVLFAVAGCGSSPTPAAAPSSSPSQASTIASGHGDKVISPFHLTAGDYRMTWTAQGTGVIGIALLGLIDTLGDPNTGVLVNEAVPPASGEVLLKGIHGGDYYLEITAGTLTWKVSFTRI